MHSSNGNPRRSTRRAASHLALLVQMHALVQVGMMGGLLALGRPRRQARRLAGQAAAVRDQVAERRSELTALATHRGDAMLREIQRQSKPRRWPWQQKTVRDLLGERSAEVAELAAEWSADMAAAAAARRDELLDVAQRQSKPRRWPWQPKTVRDQVDERSARLATVAADQSARLAATAAARRDTLMRQVRRQSAPRRWPWQPKTARDRFNERALPAARAAADQARGISTTTRDYLNERALPAAAAAAGQARDAGLSARDYLNERALPAAAAAAGQAREAGLSARDYLNERALPAAAAAAGQARDAGLSARSYLNERALPAAAAAAERVRGMAEHSGQSLQHSSSATARSLKGARRGVGSALDSAGDTVSSAVQRPARAISSGVKSGQRSVRHGVRLTRTFLWATLIGVVVGLLAAPESGRELRQHLRAIFERLTQKAQQLG